MLDAYSSATGGVYRLISRCAVLGASPIWRVNTSKTQARQIHFSSCVTDSGESADKSSGSEPMLARAGFFLATGAFRLERLTGFGAILADGFLTFFRVGLGLAGILTKRIAI